MFTRCYWVLSKQSSRQSVNLLILNCAEAFGGTCVVPYGLHEQHFLQAVLKQPVAPIAANGSFQRLLSQSKGILYGSS